MNYIKRNLLVAFIALILNGIWEYSVCAVYYDNEVVTDMLRLMVEATLGDVIVTVLLFNTLLIFHRNKDLLIGKAEYVSLAIAGILGAFYFENRALSVNRWAYSESMGLLFGTGVGVLPVLQFILLIPGAIMIAQKVQSKLI